VSWLFDLFGALSAGAAVMLPAPGERDPAHWAQLIQEHRVTLWDSAPALLQLLADHGATAKTSLSSLRLVLVSGGWIPVALPDQLRALAGGASVVALGGATEASICLFSIVSTASLRSGPALPTADLSPTSGFTSSMPRCSPVQPGSLAKATQARPSPGLELRKFRSCSGVRAMGETSRRWRLSMKRPGPFGILLVLVMAFVDLANEVVKWGGARVAFVVVAAVIVGVWFAAGLARDDE
jgi:AMP-binding enzyme